MRRTVASLGALFALSLLALGIGAAYQTWQEQRATQHYQRLIDRAVAAHASGAEVYALLGRDQHFSYSKGVDPWSVVAGSRRNIGISPLGCAIALSLHFSPGGPTMPWNPTDIFASDDTLERADAKVYCSGT